MRYTHTIKEVREMNAKYTELYVYNGNMPVPLLSYYDVEDDVTECLCDLPDEMPCEFAIFDKTAYYAAEFDRVLQDGESVLMVVIPCLPTYDVVFDNDGYSSCMGWAEPYEDCMEYIRRYNGTDESYFADYKGGMVSIYCNETEKYVYEVKIPCVENLDALCEFINANKDWDLRTQDIIEANGWENLCDDTWDIARDGDYVATLNDELEAVVVCRPKEEV